jgi:hypothetical protein
LALRPNSIFRGKLPPEAFFCTLKLSNLLPNALNWYLKS